MVRAKLASGRTKCRIVYYSGIAVQITKFLMNEEYKLFLRWCLCIFIVLQDVVLFCKLKKGSDVALSKQDTLFWDQVNFPNWMWHWYSNLFLLTHRPPLTTTTYFDVNDLKRSWPQCPRTDLNKRFLPRQKTTTAWKLIPRRSNISKNWKPSRGQLFYWV